MIKPIIFHKGMSENSTYTFDFGVLVNGFMVKNLTEGDIKVSFGEEIDENSYSLLPTKTSEIIFTSYINKEEQRTDKVTVQSNLPGIVEIRLLEY